MEIVLGIVVLVAVAVAVAAVVTAVAVARGARGRPAPVDAEALARRLADEQRRQAVEERDAAIHAAVRAASQQLTTQNQEVLARERQLVARELDTRKELIEQRLDAVATGLRQVGETIHRLEEDRKHAFGGLERELRMLHENNETLRAETGNLVTALRNPSTRGRWGEMQLRRAVEMAGMLKHCDFVEQTTVDGEDGRLRPDLIVRLPGAKQAVVDAKVPLHAYLEAVEATDEATERAKLADHARQVRSHIDTLASKAYWSQFPESPDFVVMFVPGDQLLAAAFEHEPALMEHAVANRVLIATPVTLIALLRSIAYGWQQEGLAENARQIAEAGRVLHDRLGTFAGHLKKVGSNLDRAVGAFNEAVGSYDARVVPAARRLADLRVTEDETASLPAVEKRTRAVSGAEPDPGAAVIDLTRPDEAGDDRAAPRRADRPAEVEPPPTLALEA